MYELLTTLYSLCNDAGPYKLINGDVDVVQGGVEDDDLNPEAGIVHPTLYEYHYTIKFLSAVNTKDLYKTIYNSFKSQKSNYKTIDIDPFAITVCFGDNDEGLYLAITKETRTIYVSIGYQSLVIEGQTGAFGTEIGLPIDHENCESTGIGGVSTPTGGFSSDDEETDKKKKRKLLSVVDEASDEEGSEEESEVEEPTEDDEEPEKGDVIDPGKDDVDPKDVRVDDKDRYRCPKCESPNVNSDGEIVLCSDCGYTWELVKKEGGDVDNMLPQEDDVNASDAPENLGRQETNDVECIETQQNVDRSQGIS